jgi:hypothetical protein
LAWIENIQDAIFGNERGIYIEPIVTGDDDSTGPGVFALLDLVDLVQTFTLIGSFQLLGQLVIADAASIDNGFGRERVLTRREEKNWDLIVIVIGTSENDAPPLLLPRFGQHHQRHIRFCGF